MLRFYRQYVVRSTIHALELGALVYGDSNGFTKEAALRFLSYSRIYKPMWMHFVYSSLYELYDTQFF